jgi:ureidoglycolate lyase
MQAERSATPRRLTVEPATPQSVAPFGQMLGRSGDLRPIGVSYYQGVATSRPVDYQCKGETELSLSCLEPRPGSVRYLERHFQHTQTFVPLAGKPFILVMAPPNKGAMPDLDQVRALHFDGTAGFMMFVGTWHEFPFALVPATDLVVVLSAQTTVDLKNKSADGHEASGPDLQKLDIVRRAGVVFEFDVPTA